MSKPMRAPKVVNTVTVDSDDNPSLSSAWQSLGAERGFDPTPLDRCRWLLLGEPKVGKTHFAMSWPGWLLLDFEDAGRNVVGAKATRVRVRNYGDLDAIHKQLAADAARGKRQFKGVIYDTIDRMVDIVAEQLTEELSKDVFDYGQGKGGYRKIQDRLLRFLCEDYKAGYGWGAVMHIKWEKTGEDSYSRRPAPFPGIVGRVTQDADYYLQVERITTPHIKRSADGKTTRKEYENRTVIHTVNREGNGYNSELGVRVPLPEEIEIGKTNGYSEVRKAWDDAVAKERERETEITE